MLVFCVLAVLNTIFPSFNCVANLEQNVYDTKEVMMGGYSSIAHQWFRLPSAPGVPSRSRDLHIRGKCFADHPGHLHRLYGIRSVVRGMMLNALSLSCPTKSDVRPALVPLPWDCCLIFGILETYFPIVLQQKPPNRRLLCSFRLWSRSRTSSIAVEIVV